VDLRLLRDQPGSLEARGPRRDKPEEKLPWDIQLSNTQTPEEEIEAASLALTECVNDFETPG
jgi:hypothetical protein